MQTDSIDKAYEAFLKLLTEVKHAEGTFFTETDARIKIIDDVLITVLGWSKADMLTEEQAGKGYLDYKLSLDGRAVAIVEAKRVSLTFDLGNRENGADYKLSGSVFKNADATEGILQAIQYSAFKGTELACVTNGKEWIIFRSNRIGDGSETLDGKAFVFTSLEGIKDQFNLFHDLMSREAVSSLVFRALFQEAEGRIIRHPHFKKRLRMSDSARFLVQADIVPALDRIMTTFFQRLTNDNDLEMLEECFVETKESKAAEQKLLRLADALIGTIRGLNTGSGDQLVQLLERARASKLNQFILIVGTKGAGKSTFIQRFFHLKLPTHLSQACVPIVINLGNSDGDEKTVVEWLRKETLEKAENALGGGPPSWDEIVGHMFFAEYQRWSTGSMKHLYERDKQEFKIQFGNHIEGIRKSDPLEYLHGLLRNLVRGRKQVPCLVFDNADHFSIDFQERVFQFARSLFEQELCVVIMPITDKTSWQLSRDGASQSFENEALLLPTPSAKQVVEKRTKFVLAKLNSEHPKERETYFFGKGITVDFSDLIKFVTALQELFLNSSNAALWIGGLSNHDVRRLLEISRDMINSPHLGFDEAFKAYVIGTAVQVPDSKIRAALIRGRYDIYMPETHKYVHNILDLNGEIATTPLLGLRILQVLKDAAIKHGETRSNYISKSDLYSYLAAMGIERRAIILWIDAMLKRALILNYDPTCVDEAGAKQLEISPAGEQHLYWGTGNFDYLFAIAEIFPFLDENTFKQLHYLYRSNASELKIVGNFLSYVLREDKMFCKIPDHESFNGQTSLTNALQATRQMCFGAARIPGKIS